MSSPRMDVGALSMAVFDVLMGSTASGCPTFHAMEEELAGGPVRQVPCVHEVGISVIAGVGYSAGQMGGSKKGAVTSSGLLGAFRERAPKSVAELSGVVAT